MMKLLPHCPYLPTEQPRVLPQYCLIWKETRLFTVNTPIFGFNKTRTDTHYTPHSAAEVSQAVLLAAVL